MLLRLLPRDLAADVFEYLPLEDQENVLKALGSEQVVQILNDIAPDDRTALLEELPAAATQKLLNLLSPEERKIATELLGYPKNSIGRRMTPRYVAIQQNWTVSEVLADLRRQEHKRDAMNQLYVTDSKGRLGGFRPPPRLGRCSAADFRVGGFGEPADFPARDRRSGNRRDRVQKYFDVSMLPVVDSNEVLVGVVTVDDILDVAEREATEDIQRLGGVQALDAPYLKTNVLAMVRKRAPWLAILFVGEMLTSVTLMQNYGGEVQKIVALSFFMPLILSCGGNERFPGHVTHHPRDGCGRCVVEPTGGAFSSVNSRAVSCSAAFWPSSELIRVVVWQWFSFLRDYGSHYSAFALVIGVSLVGVVLWGGLGWRDAAVLSCA